MLKCFPYIYIFFKTLCFLILKHTHTHTHTHTHIYIYIYVYILKIMPLGYFLVKGSQKLSHWCDETLYLDM